jgi:hypothetical protein
VKIIFIIVVPASAPPKSVRASSSTTARWMDSVVNSGCALHARVCVRRVARASCICAYVQAAPRAWSFGRPTASSGGSRSSPARSWSSTSSRACGTGDTQQCQCALLRCCARYYHYDCYHYYYYDTYSKQSALVFFCVVYGVAFIYGLCVAVSCARACFLFVAVAAFSRAPKA